MAKQRTQLKFYKTKSFQKLDDRWKKKLEESGFADIEASENNLKQWESSRFLEKAKRERYLGFAESDAEYYRMVGHFLHQHVFECEKDRVVWELHSNGLSLREISEEMENRNFDKNKKDAVRSIVVRLTKLMFETYNSGRSDESEE